VLENGNGGDVGQRLCRVDIGLPQATLADVEEVEGADALAAQSHRQGVRRVEPRAQGLRGEARPARLVGGQVAVHDRLAGAVAVDAGTLPSLQLEELQDPHRLAGGGHHPQVAVGRHQHEPGGTHVQHVDASVGQKGQQFHDVKVGHQGIGQLRERLGQNGLSRARTFGETGTGH
jgi:hypothetical protein